MPRVGLNFAEVAAAFEKLLICGEQPTAEKIHEFLGKGTIPVIQKHLNEIFAQSRMDLLSTPNPEETANTPAAKSQAKLAQDLLTPVITTKGVETSSSEPVIATEIPVTTTEPAVENQNNQTGRKFKRERFTRPNQNSGQNSHPNHQNRHIEFEEPVEVSLENLSEETLTIKIRRLESILLKEQMRREVAERITEETREYAESIKEQVAQRINDLRQNMDIVIEQLKAQLREQKQNFDQDLNFYQEQLTKANEKIASLVK